MIKKILYLLMLPFVLNAQTEWQWQYPFPQGNDYSCALTLDSLVTIAGGECGSIIRTSDSGDNWEIVYIPEKKSSMVMGFSFTMNYLIALLDSTELLVSSDKGKRWEKLSEKITNPFIKLSGTYNTLWTRGINNSIYKSIDLGVNWSETKFDSVAKIDDLFFLNDTLGWAIGSKSYKNFLFRTTDNGVKWDLVSKGTGIYSLIKFIDSNNGWRLDNSSSCQKTSDGGKSWVTKRTDYYSRLQDISSIDKNNVYLSAGGTIFKTTNGGDTWNKEFQYGKSYLQNCGFIFSNYKDQIVFAMGYTGSILRKSKKDLDWIKLNESTKNLFSSIHFYKQHGLSVSFSCDTSSHSSIYESSDSGINWKRIKSFDQSEIRKVWLINDKSYICAGRMLYKSTDGGAIWISKLDPQTYIYSLAFIDNQNGWAGGLGGKLFKTTDAGETWHPQNLNTTFGILAIHFIDQQYGWLTGENGIIFKTTDGGQNWEKLSTPVYSTNTSVFFRDYFNGCMAGEAIYKTTDGGKNWTTVLVPEEYIQVMKFANDLTGYAAGANGLMYKSTDAGNTWIKQNIITNEKIWDMFYDDETTGWICGDGLIMKNEGTLVYNERISTIANNYFLQQNYPNPFNPSTTIRYSIKENTNVTLKVFDMLGKEVITLVDEYIPAGNYEIEFNAKNLASGIYYYQLKTASYSDVKKMVFIK